MELSKEEKDILKRIIREKVLEMIECEHSFNEENKNIKNLYSKRRINYCLRRIYFIRLCLYKIAYKLEVGDLNVRYNK